MSGIWTLRGSSSTARSGWVAADALQRRGWSSGEVFEPAPQRGKRRVERAKRHRRAGLEIDDVVRNDEMTHHLCRGAHPGHVGRLVADHERSGRREVGGK